MLCEVLDCFITQVCIIPTGSGRNNIIVFILEYGLSKHCNSVGVPFLSSCLAGSSAFMCLYGRIGSRKLSPIWL